MAGAALLLLAVIATTLVVDAQTAPGSADGGQLIPLSDGALHVDISGSKHARAIVLLHGLAESTSFWDRMAPLLARRYRVVRVDLLGHGRCAKPASGV